MCVNRLSLVETDRFLSFHDTFDPISDLKQIEPVQWLNHVFVDNSASDG